MEPFPPGSDEATLKVWRYCAFHKLLWAIRERKLWLTLLDVFHRSDPFEASVPNSQKDHDFLLYIGAVNSRVLNPASARQPQAPVPDLLEETPKMRRAVLRAAHASCWRYGEEESEAMWRLYCPGSDGVAICSTYAKLRDSISSDPYTMVSLVKYVNYRTGAFARHRYAYDPALHKRIAFAHEQEVRVLRIRPEDVTNARADESITAEDHFEIEWNPESVIDQIIVGPQCPEAYVTVFKEAIERFSADLALRVKRSEMVAPSVY